MNFSCTRLPQGRCPRAGHADFEAPDFVWALSHCFRLPKPKMAGGGFSRASVQCIPLKTADRKGQRGQTAILFDRELGYSKSSGSLPLILCRGRCLPSPSPWQLGGGARPTLERRNG